MGAIRDVVEQATKGVSFDRLIVCGFFSLLGFIASLSVALVWKFPDGEHRTVEAVLKFFESSGLMLVGALVSTLQHRGKEDKNEGKGE